MALGSTGTLGFPDARAKQGVAILSSLGMFILQNAVNMTKSINQV